mmetsp:Transcript_37537/g.61020  ORF Transcript_37537/g.61020 Transcript_37537/m.61020 type:complete len:87 (+) Transcript_37537:60-320(+)
MLGPQCEDAKVQVLACVQEIQEEICVGAVLCLKQLSGTCMGVLTSHNFVRVIILCQSPLEPVDACEVFGEESCFVGSVVVVLYVFF